MLSQGGKRNKSNSEECASQSHKLGIKKAARGGRLFCEGYLLLGKICIYIFRIRRKALHIYLLFFTYVADHRRINSMQP